MRDPWDSAPVENDQNESGPVMTETEPNEAIAEKPTAIRYRLPGRQPNSDQVADLPRESDAGVPNTAGAKQRFQLDQSNLIQGVIWAEILGKPKAKRGQR
jgi:hypothetical protein